MASGKQLLGVRCSLHLPESYGLPVSLYWLYLFSLMTSFSAHSVSDPHNFGFTWSNTAPRISLYTMTFQLPPHTFVYFKLLRKGESDRSNLSSGHIKDLGCLDQVCTHAPITCGPESLGYKTWLSVFTPLTGDMGKEKKNVVT